MTFIIVWHAVRNPVVGALGQIWVGAPSSPPCPLATSISRFLAVWHPCEFVWSQVAPLPDCYRNATGICSDTDTDRPTDSRRLHSKCHRELRHKPEDKCAIA